MTLNAYLFFDGQAEEALNFYKQIFDGKIEMLSRFDSMPNSVAAEYQNHLMHARLIFGDNLLMFSDIMPGNTQPFIHGDSFSLAIGIEKDEEAATKVFNDLAEGGTVTMPLAKQFWGALYGQVTDRFGTQWMINCQL